jgi:hypothetical protein
MSSQKLPFSAVSQRLVRYPRRPTAILLTGFLEPACLFQQVEEERQRSYLALQTLRHNGAKHGFGRRQVLPLLALPDRNWSIEHFLQQSGEIATSFWPPPLSFFGPGIQPLKLTVTNALLVVTLGSIEVLVSKLNDAIAC